MMNLKKIFTPKNVEEIKPGFFIQEKGNTYRQIHPLVWNNKWRLKGQIKWGSILTIIILIFLYFSLVGYIEFYQEVNTNPEEFCMNVSILNWELEAINENTNTIQFDIAEAPATRESR